jgi:exodeoxyribonuclease VII large subunit
MIDPILSVSDLCQHIKNLLDGDELLRNCFVRGEISNLKFSPSGHLYFTLKDALGQIACVLFLSEQQALKFKLQDGMKVVAYGRVSIFAGRSQYQLIVQDIKPDGLGELYVAFEKLKQKLEKEGLFDQAHKKPLPYFPQTVGIVTSLQAAALRDMLAILQKRNPAVQIIISPSLVQGVEAPESLIKALHRLQSIPSVEVIIMSRGGGSLEELWAFNDENLAREIFHCKIPVISAVGHETDFTIADFVADRRASTPSNAAEIVAPDRESLLSHLRHLYERLRLALSRKLEHDEKLLQALLNRPVFRFPLAFVEREIQTLDLLEEKLDRLFQDKTTLAKMQIKHLEERLEALSPKAILKRGYALVIHQKKIIKSAKEAVSARKVEVLFQDGKVSATFAKQALSKIAAHVTHYRQQSFLE